MLNKDKTLISIKNGMAVVAYRLEDIEDATMFGQTISEFFFDGPIKEVAHGAICVNELFKDITDSPKGAMFIKSFFQDFVKDQDTLRVYFDKGIYIGLILGIKTTIAINYGGRTAINTNYNKDTDWAWVEKKRRGNGDVH